MSMLHLLTRYLAHNQDSYHFNITGTEYCIYWFSSLQKLFWTRHVFCHLISIICKSGKETRKAVAVDKFLKSSHRSNCSVGESCSENFQKIQWKTPAMEFSLPTLANELKIRLHCNCFWFYKIFQHSLLGGFTLAL